MVSMEAAQETPQVHTNITTTTTTVKPLHPSPYLPQPRPPLGHSDVTHFHLSGLKVVVHLKHQQPQEEEEKHRPLVTFFSRSGCRDSSAVRTFLRDRLLPYVEINLDVFPSREAELHRRTSGPASVPQVFLGGRLLGGLAALNSMRRSGEFDRLVRGEEAKECPPEGSPPRAPVYGEEEEVEEERDEMEGIVGAVRAKVEVRDRISRMKVVRSCFVGYDLVEAVIDHLDCGRKKMSEYSWELKPASSLDDGRSETQTFYLATQVTGVGVASNEQVGAISIGKELARKHFICQVFRENDFEDGNHLYRFLEHDPAIPRCFNFTASTGNKETKAAFAVGQRLTKLMIAVLEAYASDDRRHIDYNRISISEEFRRYVKLTHDLQRVDVFALSSDERTAFFFNLYNAMVIHAIISMGPPEGAIERRSFFNDFHYMIGGYPYSLSTIKHGILRSNRRQPYSFAKPFGAEDKRLELALPKMNSLVHFGMCDAARSSPPVRFFSGEGINWELRQAAREFFESGGLQVDLGKRTVHLSSIIKWYSADFGQGREILKWALDFLDARNAGLLTYLLGDGGPINIAYQNFDWSLNL